MEAELEKNLNEALVTTFLANLSFLNEYDNELFQRIDRLSQSIENNEYKERYFLEFLKDKGDFDIYDSKNEVYVYNKNPKKTNNKAKNLDFSSDGSFSNLLKDAYDGRKYNISIDKEIPTSQKKSDQLVLNDLSEYIDVFNDHLETYKTKKYKEVNKFIFIGTLLGRHIIDIHKKYKSKYYFVCESNLEIFRLSLFVLDYTVLVRDDSIAVFSIMDEKYIFNQKINSFLNYHPMENYYVKYFTTDYNVSEYFNDIADGFLSTTSFTFNHRMVLNNLANNASLKINNYNTLQINKIIDPVIDKPVLFVAAGPSLDDEIEWLESSSDKFVVVALGASYKKLLNHNIVPDIVATIESSYDSMNKQFDDESIKKLKDTLIFASSMTDQRILDKFDKSKVFILDVMRSYYAENYCYQGYSVGEITASLLLAMKCKELYLLGLDLALNQDTGTTHTADHKNSEKLDLENITSFVDSGSFSLREDIISTKGNFSKEVYTTRIFMTSINALSNNIDEIIDDTFSIYNLSTHGAYFNGTKPLRTNEITTELSPLDKKSLNLQKRIEAICSSKLSDYDIEKLKEEIIFIEKILNNITLLRKEKNITSFLELKEEINLILEDVYNPKLYTVFSPIFLSSYLSMILQYVYYCFNDKKLKKEKLKVGKVLSILESQLSDLMENYEIYLKRIMM